MIHSVFSARDFERIDDEGDSRFYTTPRLVVHIDAQAVSSIAAVLGRLVPPGAEILDLMSSWRSHLPIELKPTRVVGLGMNATEMGENEQLDEWVVHDLNRDPSLPFADRSFDVVINTVSVQYLVHPVEVFSEVRRVLRPGGRAIVIFSNRMFPTKAVRIWRESSEAQRVDLVRRYLEDAGGFAEPQSQVHDTGRAAAGARLNWLALSGDPVYVVTAQRPIEQ